MPAQFDRNVAAMRDMKLMYAEGSLPAGVFVDSVSSELVALVNGEAIDSRRECIEGVEEEQCKLMMGTRHDWREAGGSARFDVTWSTTL